MTEEDTKTPGPQVPPETETPERIEGAPATAEDAAEEEFPSLAGYPEVETAERSADVHEAESEVFARDYLALIEDWKGLGNKEHFDKKNGAALITAATQQGLRTTGQPRRVSAKKHLDGFSIYLRYEVAVVPAAVAESALTEEADPPPGE